MQNKTSLILCNLGSNQIFFKEKFFYFVDFIKHGNVKDIIYLNHCLFYLKNRNLIIGKPLINNIKIEAFIIKHLKFKKVFVFRFKRKKNYKKKFSYKPIKTLIYINKIYI